MSNDPIAYLKADRQWKRANRIDHATFQLKKAQSEGDKVFWRTVLRANGGHYVITRTPKPISAV